jgi:hypothetical protein
MSTRPPKVPHQVTPSSSSGAERRQHARATADWPVLLDLPEGSVPARLRDISAAGVCFFLDRAVPEMTVLALELQFGKRKIRARGAVVRSEKISPHLEHYEIALFLHDIAESDRAVIARYVGGTSRSGQAAT